MKSNLKTLADEVRNIDLGYILKSKGYHESKEGISTKYTSDAHAINVTGSKWYDHKSGIGGGGAIDLVMYMEQCPYKEAVLSLADFRGVTNVSPLPEQRPAPERKPFAELMKTYGKRDDTLWPLARHYLVETRCLPAPLVDEAFASGKIYANDHRPNPSLVFLHTDANGTVQGATLRDTVHQSGFRPCLGNKTEAWFTFHCPLHKADSVVLVESPIDALSWHARTIDKDNPLPTVAVVSLAGCHTPDALLQFCQQKQIKITPAFDNDTAGREEIRRLQAMNNPLIERPAIPYAKDWNEELCAVTRPRFVPRQKKSPIKGIKL
ncbi:MAG: toprim domain-containing protein [Verrucomicrobiae bacterium]|nr:toprim domain-containing protein [Verrucomicrobiae bacterium]